MDNHYSQQSHLLDFLGDEVNSAQGGFANSALLLLDLERLDFVSWHLGLNSRELIQRNILARLKDLLPEQSVPSYWNGKLVLLLRKSSQAEAVSLAYRIAAICSAPHRLGGQDVFVPPIVGIAMVHGHYTDSSQLLQDALFALDDARNTPNGGVRLYDPERKKFAQQELEIENCLRSAVENGNQFRIVYQPLLRLDDHGCIRLDGFESLTRWNHPTLGAVPPDKFIPIAERCGLIAGLGNFVLWEACRQQVEWARRFGRKVTMSVNLSAVQLRLDGIEDTVMDALSDTEMDPSYLKLEVTETALALDPPFLAKKLKRLREIGVSVGVDDFGSGYSSLGQLDLFGLDFMKIDKSLIQRLGPGERQAELVRLATGLAKHLGMEVVAEGIEDVEHLDKLMELGVQIGQGYLFSRPLPPDQAGLWVHEGVWSRPR